MNDKKMGNIEDALANFNLRGTEKEMQKTCGL